MGRKLGRDSGGIWRSPVNESALNDLGMILRKQHQRIYLLYVWMEAHGAESIDTASQKFSIIQMLDSCCQS